METIVLSALVVALAEIGDKTQVLAVLLGARFRKPWAVIAGIVFATLANHVFAALLGYYAASFIAGTWFRYLVAIAFIAMAAWALVPETFGETPSLGNRGAFIATLVAFFLVEIGDKTQVAAIALAARFHSIWLVTLGTTLGVLIADAPAVFFAEAATRVVPVKSMRLISAGVFLVLGLWALAGAAKLF